MLLLDNAPSLATTYAASRLPRARPSTYVSIYYCTRRYLGRNANRDNKLHGTYHLHTFLRARCAYVSFPTRALPHAVRSTLLFPFSLSLRLCLSLCICVYMHNTGQNFAIVYIFVAHYIQLVYSTHTPFNNEELFQNSLLVAIAKKKVKVTISKLFFKLQV